MHTITKQEWLDALRSGKYKQCRKRLHDPETGGFCCLGVALDLMGMDWTDYSPLTSDDQMLSYFAHLEHITGVGLDYTLENLLATANDEGKRFTTIAKMIEAL